MKFKRVMAGILAGSMLTAMSVAPVFADDIAISATIGFTDSSWEHQDWATTVTVTGDGQYTLTTTDVAGATDLYVFVVDLTGMYESYPDATATLDSVVIDGNEMYVDSTKIIYGDIEEKGNYRIEIYNEYGDTKSDSGINKDTAVAESISVTFTVSGLGVEAGGDGDTSPVAYLAAIVAVAGVALVASKKVRA